jgi:iron complex outermembrane receptor protein
MQLKKLALGVAIASSLSVPSLPILAQQTAGLEEVVITAQRRAQNLDSVGVAINAFDGDQLKDLGFADVGDIALLTPGINLTETGVTGVPVYTIRGVGFDDYSSNSTATVGIYVDEVSLPYPTMTRGPQFDLERIEVLKGPQGTLYGRNTTGGAINLISRKPTDAFEAGFRVGYGRFETLDAEAYVSGPLSDAVRGRLALSSTRSGEGWQQSSSRPGDTLGEQDKWALKTALQIDLSDSATLMLRAHGYRDKSENPAPQYFTYIPLVPALADFFPAPDPGTTPNLNDTRSADWSADFTPQRDNEGSGFSATVNWDLGAITLTSITAFEQFERQESNDWDGTAIENLDVFFSTDIDVFSQELRLSGDLGDSITWVAGAYYSTDEVDESWISRGSAATIYQGVFGAVDTRYTQESDTLAVFGQAEWQFTDSLRATLGLRYTEEERDFSACSYDVDGGLAFLYSGVNLGPFPGVADNIFLSSSALSQGDCVTINTAAGSFEIDPNSGAVTVFSGASGVFNDSSDYNNVSGKLGLDWSPHDDLLVYTSYSRGFKSGGYNGAASSSWSQLAPYDEEILNAYELGIKTRMADNRVRLTGALFYYDYSDKQIIGSVADEVFGLLTQIVNVPESTISGAELELEWQATEGLYLRLGASLLDSEIEEFVGLSGTGVLTDFKGRELAQTPKLQLTGQADYRFAVSDSLYARVGTDFSYSDEYQSAPDPADIYFIPDYTVWNARIGFGAEDGNWEVLLWGRNITDEYYFTSANISNDYWFRSTGSPRSWGVSLNMQF